MKYNLKLHEKQKQYQWKMICLQMKESRDKGVQESAELVLTNHESETTSDLCDAESTNLFYTTVNCQSLYTLWFDIAYTLPK